MFESLIFSLLLLWVMLLWVFVYKLLHEYMYSFSLGIYLGLKLLGHMVTLCLIFCQTVFQSDCSISRSHKRCRRASVSLHPYQDLFFFPQLYWSIIDKNFTHLRCTTWCFNTPIYCEMITTIKLINIHHFTVSYLFVGVCWEHLAILANFKYIYSSCIIETLPALTNISTFSPSPSPWLLPFYCLLLWVRLF